jgi:hypothetical protein
MVGGYQAETPFQRRYREMLQAAAVRQGVLVPTVGQPLDSHEEEPRHRARRREPIAAVADSERSRSNSVDSSALESSVSHPGVSSRRGSRHRSYKEQQRSNGDRRRRRHRRSSRSSDEDSRHSRDSQWETMQRENKQEMVIELTKLRSMGVSLSFEPSMDEPLWKLKHEYQQHDAHMTLIQRVSVVKKCIKMATLLLSTFAGKFLKLEGWSEYVHESLDTGAYDSALEQVYRSVAGRGRPNCWVHIVLLVGGTAVCYHISNAMKDAGAADKNENLVFKVFNMASRAMDIMKPSFPSVSASAPAAGAGAGAGSSAPPASAAGAPSRATSESDGHGGPDPGPRTARVIPKKGGPR